MLTAMNAEMLEKICEGKKDYAVAWISINESSSDDRSKEEK